MPSMTLRPISGTGTSWSNIANAYDTSGTSTVSTVSLRSSNYSNRVGIFDFDLSSFPSNAKMTEATLTINAKASANSRITLYGDIDGDSSKRIGNSSVTLTTTQTDYTADVTNYISNWIPSSEDEDDTSTTGSLAYGPSSKYLTLCDGIKIDEDYWSYDGSYVTTEFINITNIKSMSFSFVGYDDRELYLYSWYLSKDTSMVDITHNSSTLSQSDLESYRNQGYKYACAIVQAQSPYSATVYSGEVLVNFTYLEDITNIGWTYSSYPGVGMFYWDEDGKWSSDTTKSTEKWIVTDLFPNNSTTVEFYIYNDYDGSFADEVYCDYWGSNGNYGGYENLSMFYTSGTENGRSYEKITLFKTDIQDYKYIALSLSYSYTIDERDIEIVVKTGAAIDQTSGGSSTNGGTLHLTGYTTSSSSTTLSIYDIVLNIEYTTCETKLGNTSVNYIYLGQTEIAEVYLGTTLVYQKVSSSSGDSGDSGVSEEVLTLYQGSPEQNKSTYDGNEEVVTTAPIDITNLKSLTVTITQTDDDSVYIMYLNEYDENKLFIGDNYVGQSMSLQSYTLSESDLNNFRTLDTYLSFTIISNTFHELYPSVLTVTAYYTYY